MTNQLAPSTITTDRSVYFLQHGNRTLTIRVSAVYDTYTVETRIGADHWLSHVFVAETRLEIVRALKNYIGGLSSGLIVGGEFAGVGEKLDECRVEIAKALAVPLPLPFSMRGEE